MSKCTAEWNGWLDPISHICKLWRQCFKMAANSINYPPPTFNPITCLYSYSFVEYLLFIDFLFCDFRPLFFSSSSPIDTKSVEDLMGSTSGVHFSGFHMDGLEQRKAGMDQPTTSEADMYKQPFVIGVFLCRKLPM